MRFVFSAAALACTMSVLGAASIADTVDRQPSLTGVVEERFSDYVQVAGSLIVGAAFIEAPVETQNVEMRALRVSLPPDVSGKVCFNSVSRDGLYSSVGALKRPRESANTYKIQPDDRWTLTDKAARYVYRDFAARVSVGDKCDIDRSAPILPVSVKGAGTTNRLTLSVNSQRALSVSAKLVAENGAATNGECKRLAQGSSRAFDTTCSFAVGGLAAGRYRAVIGRAPEAGPFREDEATIVLVR